MTDPDLQLPPITADLTEPTRPLNMDAELDRSTLWALAAPDDPAR